MKKLGIYVNNGFHTRALLTKDFLEALYKVEIIPVLICDSEDKKLYLMNRYENINVIAINISKYPFSDILNKYMSNSREYNNNSDTYKLRRNIIKRKSKVLYYLKFITYFPLKIKFVAASIVYLYYLSLRSIFERNNQIEEVDSILFPIVPNSHTINSLILRFRDLGKYTFSYAVSFDNVSSKVNPLISTDFIIVWNKIQKNEAEDILGWEECKIIISGAMHFDYFNKRELIVNRAHFLTKYGLSKDDEYILFGTVNPVHISNNRIYIKELIRILNILNLNDLKVIVRLHPQTVYISQKNEYSEDLNDFMSIVNNIIRLNIPKLYGDMLDFDLHDDDINELMNLIYHSKFIVGFSSSLTIDAMIFNKPVINFGYALNKRDENIITTGYNYTHYKNLIENNVVKIPKSKEEMEKVIADIVFKNENDYDNLNAPLRDQLPNLGNAGKLTASEISRIICN